MVKEKGEPLKVAREKVQGVCAKMTSELEEKRVLEANREELKASVQDDTKKVLDELSKSHDIFRKAWGDAAARVSSAFNEIPGVVVRRATDAQSREVEERPKKRPAGAESGRTPAEKKRNRQ